GQPNWAAAVTWHSVHVVQDQPWCLGWGAGCDSAIGPPLTSAAHALGTSLKRCLARTADVWLVAALVAWVSRYSGWLTTQRGRIHWCNRRRLSVCAAAPMPERFAAKGPEGFAADWFAQRNKTEVELVVFRRAPVRMKMPTRCSHRSE